MRLKRNPCTLNVVEGIKVICHELTQATNEPEIIAMEDLIKDVDRLVSCLATKVYHRIPGSVQLELVFLTFQIKRLAHTVKESTLNILITELLLWLLDERVPLMDDGSQLLKALNVLMLKILGTAIKGYLSMVPLDLEPQPIILAHIDLNLQTLAAARMLTPSRPIGQTQWGDSVYN
ncbi:hypothetical protein AMTR_s00016p00260400 [Amborella trichopoda]|uniref:Uncharacterized protein n=1 Tax=Amborella trichopoda TaxID=13333 RepID=W1P993_AMBTC|nr:hypothetical protein AMTR_s00016p00260400 [Amborella trichopoda]